MEKLTKKEVFSLSMDAYNRTSSNVEYTAEERGEGFQAYLQDLGKNYRMNKDEIFQIMEETASAILPRKVEDMVKQFAEFKNVDNNTTIKFKIRKGKIKAVEVALGGQVERQRIDNGTLMLPTEAIECKVYEEFERVIGGYLSTLATL